MRTWWEQSWATVGTAATSPGDRGSFYGERPSLLAQLHIILQDGTERTIATDTSWKTAPGPILENDLLMGEAYDARLELGAWSQTGL